MNFLQVVLLIATLALPGAAQVGASLGGTIVDDSGAVMVGVEVVARNVRTEVRTTLRTDFLGNFLFENLPPGVYWLTAAPPDSGSITYTGIELGTSDTRTFRMQASPLPEPNEGGDLSVEGTVLFVGR